MTISTISKRVLALTAVIFCQAAVAYANPYPWYVSGDLGIFRGDYDAVYNDKTDIFAQNIRQPILQHGYTGGVAAGYTRNFCGDYFWAVELTGNIATDNAYFAAGSSSSGFTDRIRIQDYFDLLFVPGFYVTNSVAAYVKAGVSLANIRDSFNSPAGYVPAYVNSTSNNFVWGLALGIGMKKFLTDQVVVFSEYQYHDYSVQNFPGFQNFTATYSHSAHIYSQALTIGLSYLFGC